MVYLETITLKITLKYNYYRFTFYDSAVSNFNGSIPKGPSCFIFWVKDKDQTVAEQTEYYTETISLITSPFECKESEIFEICPGQLVLYIKLELCLANKTIYKHLSKLK